MSVFCLIFDVREQQIIAHRHPYLSHHSILAGPEEGFDLQVLLDPLEEQLNLPPSYIPGAVQCTLKLSGYCPYKQKRLRESSLSL